MPKILCLTGYSLNRPDCGASVRALNVFRLLARVGEVRVMLASNVEANLRDATSPVGGFELLDVVRFRTTGRLPPLDRLRYEFDGQFLNTHGYQAEAKDIARLHALIADHDLVWIHGLRIANGFGLWRWPRSVLDIDDIQSCVHHTAMTSARSWLQKLRQYRQVLMWRRRERHLRARFDALCVCSAPDQTELTKLLGVTNKIQVLPNGFTTPAKTLPRCLAVPPRIGFLGSFHHQPNREGLRWFIRHVWPLVRRTAPAVRLRVVGDGSDNEAWKTLENVEVLGWVADVESEMATWSLTVVPIFFGGGTRIKTAEAFSRKCPVVSTTLGVYGYEVVDGAEVLIADSLEEFASKCLRLLSDPSAGVAMAERAWQKFLKCWTWDASADRVAGVVKKVLRTETAPGPQEAQAVLGTAGHE
jgi:glycosyltransferase involved in cell wall biosynthesis